MMLVLIGNTNSRRILFTQKALADRGNTNYLFVSYSDILNEKADLSNILPENSCIRLESPSEDPLFETQLSGYNKNGLTQKALPRGLIFNYETWFLNYSRLLKSVESIALSKNCTFINHPQGILTAFDKYKTKEILAANNIPSTPLVGKVNNFEELQELFVSNKLSRAFVKPRYGSSASGVLAYSQIKNKISVETSVELDKSNNQLFNNLKLRKYTSINEVKQIVNELGKSGLIIEKWVPKNFLGNKVFDLRVFVINNKVKHVVVRMGKTAITNLHLGNSRGNIELVLDQYPSSDFNYICKVALDAVKCMPGLFYAGVDVILTGKKCSPYVVEINGFGDMLLGDLYNGKSTYDIFAEEFEYAFLINGNKKY